MKTTELQYFAFDRMAVFCGNAASIVEYVTPSGDRIAYFSKAPYAPEWLTGTAAIQLAIEDESKKALACIHDGDDDGARLHAKEAGHFARLQLLDISSTN